MILKLVKDDKIQQNMTKEMAEKRNEYADGVLFKSGIDTVSVNEDLLTIYYKENEIYKSFQYEIYIWDNIYLMNDKGQTIERIK